VTGLDGHDVHVVLEDSALWKTNSK